MTEFKKEGSLVVVPKCLHESATPVTTYRETPQGNVEMTKEIVCDKCGEKMWFLTSRGPTQTIRVLSTWDPQVALGTLQETSAPKKPAKKRPTPEEVVSGIRRKLGEGPGTELAVLNWQQGLVMSCQACDQLAQDMNGWGAQGCLERMDQIVDDILPRAKKWIEDNRPEAIKMFVDEKKWPQKVKDWLNGHRDAIDAAARKAGALVDFETPAVRKKIKELVDQALANWETRQKTLES